MPSLILASRSAARRAMLTAAGVAHEAVAAGIDEDAAKAALVGEGADARRLADALAELKAVKISRRYPDALVLGCDQTLARDDGILFDQPRDRADAAEQLRSLRGRRHRLTSAAVLATGGVPTWRHVGVATLTMRDFSDAFLEAYLDAEWPAIAGCVGCYRLEGPGVQLFSRVDRDHFTVLGLPLLALLDQLRVLGLITK
ncbi:Maf family protein [Sphingomonas montana]|uniref:Maf family protein n=1 Tax=Sphingomonas montana TaxID=1843236 RepID=UPI00101AD5FE|nr:Maf family protein [Sphingomonas montana]